MSCWPHDYADDGKCRNCDTLTSDAFMALLAKGLGMPPPPPGTQGLRLRPNKEPAFIPEKPD